MARTLSHSVAVRTSNALIRDIREGVTTSELDRLAHDLGMRVEDLAIAMRMSSRTLARRRQSGTLNVDESERVVRVARILEAAVAALGSVEDARVWLATRNIGLRNATPISLVDTEPGGELVRNLLGQIQHGVYS